MTNERRHPDDPSDPVVSRSYRELASERTPEHLDHVVLNAARSAAKPRLRTAMTWLRPAAWVTTIGLCLAIVLEIANMPQQDQPVFEILREEQTEFPADTPAMKELTTQGLQPATLPAGEPERAEPEAPAAIEVDAFKDADREFLREAENRARLQAGSDEEAEAGFLQVGPAVGIASDIATERYCAEPETRDPNTWLECILKLEEQGLHEAARLERELLKEAFPPPMEP